MVANPQRAPGGAQGIGIVEPILTKAARKLGLDQVEVRKINALYECARPLKERAPHRQGRDLRVGRPPTTFPLIVQGPLGLSFVREVAMFGGAVEGMVPPVVNDQLKQRFAKGAKQ